MLKMCKNIILIHTENRVMRTNIVIDDRLMNDALKATGLKTKKEAVELGLKTLIKLNQQAKIKELKGKLKWDGDLDAMRTTL
jgi:Arc/MetJ family transcription regulator